MIDLHRYARSPRTAKPRRKSPEEALQRSVVNALRLYEARGLLRFTHPANGAAKSKAVAGITKAMGQAAGAPDLLIFLPEGKCLHVELKTEAGRLSQGQKGWMADLTDLGHRYEVCRSLEAVLDVLHGAGVPKLMVPA